MLKVIVIGAGGHGKVLLDALGELGVEVVAVTDRAPENWGARVLGHVVGGDDEAVLGRHALDVQLVNGIGSTNRETLVVRREVYERLASQNRRFATVIHPAARVSRHARIEEGAQMMAGAVVQTSAVIGANSIVNTCASVDHDCVVGAHCHVAPGATLSGGVHVGTQVHIGAGATVIQGVRIGDLAVVGAGVLVRADVPAGATLRREGG